LPDTPAGYNECLSKQVESNIAQLKSSADYVLQSGDLIDIKVFMENGMDRTLRISGGGTITFPLVGNIKIADKSVAQAEEMLSAELKKYIKNPQVSLLIKEYGNTTIYILGEVKTPWRYLYLRKNSDSS
jgi:polysaccharide export outer membrane protein